MFNKPLIASAALALSVTAAQAELTERAMSVAGIDPIVQKLNSIPAFGDVLHVAERMAGRGLSQAAALDDNPLATAGFTVGGGVAGAFLGNAAMSGLADTAATGAMVTGGEGTLANVARFAANNVSGATVAGGVVGLGVGYDLSASPALVCLAPLLGSSQLVPIAVDAYQACASIPGAFIANSGRGLMQADKLDENPLASLGLIGSVGGLGATVGSAAGMQVDKYIRYTPAERQVGQELHAQERLLAQQLRQARAAAVPDAAEIAALQAERRAMVNTINRFGQHIATYEGADPMLVGAGIGAGAAMLAAGYGVGTGASVGCAKGGTLLMVSSQPDCAAIGGTVSAH